MPNAGKNAFKKPAVVVFVVFSLLIVGIEFIFDLKNNPLWYRAVLFFDVSLILSYYFFIVARIFENRRSVTDFLSHHKADAAYLVVVSVFLIFPRMCAALIIARLIFSAALYVFEIWGRKLVFLVNLKPSQSLALGFFAVILLGAVLLTFPAATVDGRGAKFIDALFMMTAATCVAGLAVMDVGLEFTRFGQGVLLFGMQTGGLGIMVLSAAFTMMVGGIIPSRKQAGLSEVLETPTPEGLKSLIRSITTMTVVIEFFGALSLFLLCREEVPGFTERAWWAIFHTVSAFCNCGLGLFSDSLMIFVDRPLVCFIFMSLITLGGLGFFVLSDISSREVWAVKKPRAIWARLQIQSKVMIVSTLAMNIFGLLVFLYFEYDGVLGGLSTFDKIVAALFQTVNLRSAGFVTVPIMHLAGPTIIFSIAYMFIGAGSGSTGGGIKLTTAFISMMAVRSMLRGREDVELFGRRISSELVARSLAIVLISATIVGVFLILLLATQNIAFERLFYEVVSAFGTVGLSLNATMSLDTMGKFLIISVMYIGRIGPLTLALAIGEKKLAQGFRYPKGSMAVG